MNWIGNLFFKLFDKVFWSRILNAISIFLSMSALAYIVVPENQALFFGGLSVLVFLLLSIISTSNFFSVVLIGIFSIPGYFYYLKNPPFDIDLSELYLFKWIVIIGFLIASGSTLLSISSFFLRLAKENRGNYKAKKTFALFATTVSIIIICLLIFIATIWESPEYIRQQK